jgi:PAS domain S-box-containing protein
MVKDRKPAGTGKSKPLPGEIEATHCVDRARQQLAAIVENSADAILTKDLDGIILSWNRGAERLFGYSSEEILGEPVTLLIPPDRQNEEPAILARIRSGERVEPYDTIRRRKDGTPVHISLSVSPIRDDRGNIVGASKIARDITERYRAQEQQRLLLKEMQHRVKNVFALASSLIGMCARRAATPEQVADMARNRLDALAQAHALTVPDPDQETSTAQPPTLHALIHALIDPHVGDDNRRLMLTGVDHSLSMQVMTPLALVLNELTTNAIKYGAWRHSPGTIAIECRRTPERLVLCWTEIGSEPVRPSLPGSGFGTRLSQMAVEHDLRGKISWEWKPTGVVVTLEFNPSPVEGLDTSR